VARFEKIVGRVSEAVASPHVRVLPPLSSAVRSWSRWRLAVWGGSMAAGIAACVAIGFLWGSKQVLSPNDEKVAKIEGYRPLSPANGDTSVGSEGGGVKDFWSPQRLRAFARENDSVPRKSGTSYVYQYFKSAGGAP